MLPATTPSDSIEHFADLAARLDDPFVERQTVLRVAGLDEERWTLLVEGWSARLSTAEGAALAERFGSAYASAVRRRYEPAAAEPEPATGAAPANAVDRVPSPLAAPSAPPSTSEPTGRALAGTTDVNWRHVREALPFASPPPGGVRLPPAAPAPPPRLGELGGTLPLGTRLPVPVLPFPSDPKPSK